MKLCCEYIRGLRYKLRMMGIAIEEPTYIYGDNRSVLANTLVPESTLKKKSHSTAYHFVRGRVPGLGGPKYAISTQISP